MEVLESGWPLAREFRDEPTASKEPPMTAPSRTATASHTLADALVGSSPGAALREAMLVIGGAALTAGAAQVAFTMPWSPVPYTLQTGAVLLVGTALGLRRGTTAMALYVLAGAAGLPIFSGHASGLASLFGATGGYLVGFVVAGALVGRLAERGWDRSVARTAALMIMGNVVIYAIGVPVLALAAGLPPSAALEKGALVFLPWDLAKVILAAGLLPLAWRFLGEGPRARH
jgi:biotin transport system substrate-specific component